MRRTHSLAALFLLTLAAPIQIGCGADSTAEAPAQPAAAPPVAVAVTPAPAPPDEPVVIFLGDSLTAGLGLPADQAYPELVERELDAAGVRFRGLNAGVSGDTTAGGLARLDWVLGQKPDVLVVALGGNDGLRGLPVEEMEKNLREIVRRTKAAGAEVLLVGMQMPPNLGPDYTRAFASVYPRIAEEMDVPLVPFLLEGVGGVDDLNQADGIHPTAEGQEKIAETVAPFLREVLAESTAQRRVEG